MGRCGHSAHFSRAAVVRLVSFYAVSIKAVERATGKQWGPNVYTYKSVHGRFCLIKLINRWEIVLLDSHKQKTGSTSCQRQWHWGPRTSGGRCPSRTSPAPAPGPTHPGHRDTGRASLHSRPGPRLCGAPPAQAGTGCRVSRPAPGDGGGDGRGRPPRKAMSRECPRGASEQEARG